MGSSRVQATHNPQANLEVLAWDPTAVLWLFLFCDPLLTTMCPAPFGHLGRGIVCAWRVAMFAAGAPSAASSVGGSAGPVPMSKTGTLVARLCPTLVELTPRAVPSSPRWVAIILPPVQHMQQGDSSGTISLLWDV